MPDTQITLSNVSDRAHPAILVVGRNGRADPAAAPPVAWRVIRHLGRGASTSFAYPDGVVVRAEWDVTPTSCSYSRVEAPAGAGRFAFEARTGGFRLVPKEPPGPGIVEVSSLARMRGGLRIALYKDGRRFLVHPAVAFGQKAELEVDGRLFWALAPCADEGAALAPWLLDRSFTPVAVAGRQAVDVRLEGDLATGYFFACTYR